MITSKIYGGLGNQMFQFATGRALSLKYNTILKLDLSWYANIYKYKKVNGFTERIFLLNQFPALMQSRQVWHNCTLYDRSILATSLVFNKIAKIFFNYTINTKYYYKENNLQNVNKLEYIKHPIYLDGYWQDEGYFSDFSYQIRKDFSFPPISDALKKFSNKIKSVENSVSVHIRRGDYVNDTVVKNIHGVLSSEYYSNAFSLIKEEIENPFIFIFSDDIEWVKTHFNTYDIPSMIIDSNYKYSELHDMHLMSLCKHHIIANSTFSWWGAWLSQEEGITIAPRQWYNINNKNPCPSRWILI